MALPWQWILEKLARQPDASMETLQEILKYIPDAQHSSLQKGLALRQLEEILASEEALDPSSTISLITVMTLPEEDTTELLQLVSDANSFDARNELFQFVQRKKALLETPVLDKVAHDEVTGAYPLPASHEDLEPFQTNERQDKPVRMRGSLKKAQNSFSNKLLPCNGEGPVKSLEEKLISVKHDKQKGRHRSVGSEDTTVLINGEEPDEFINDRKGNGTTSNHGAALEREILDSPYVLSGVAGSAEKISAGTKRSSPAADDATFYSNCKRFCRDLGTKIFKQKEDAEGERDSIKMHTRKLRRSSVESKNQEDGGYNANIVPDSHQADELVTVEGSFDNVNTRRSRKIAGRERESDGARNQVDQRDDLVNVHDSDDDQNQVDQGKELRTRKDQKLAEDVKTRRRSRKVYFEDSDEETRPNVSALNDIKQPDQATVKQEQQELEVIDLDELEELDGPEIGEDNNLETCYKCREGGKLICCDGCPMAVHERCVGITEDQLPDGEWFCPLCVLKRANDKIAKAKEEALEAKRQLERIFRKQKPGSSKPDQLDTPKILVQPPTSRNQKAKGLNSDAKTKKSEAASSDEDQTRPEGNVKVEVESDDTRNGNEQGGNASPDYPRGKAGKTGRELVPGRRRRNLPWTKLEEETLKEGVRKYSKDSGSFGFQWARILKFGIGKFDPSRTAVDLKDKWRNIKVKSGEPVTDEE